MTAKGFMADAITGCRIWSGRTTEKGYGRDGSKGAHVLAWEAVNGPVPEDLVIDHGCSNRACVFEPHLQAVTQSENLRRRAWRYRARIKLCPKGHELAMLAIVTATGGRVCRRCRDEAKQ